MSPGKQADGASNHDFEKVSSSSLLRIFSQQQLTTREQGTVTNTGNVAHKGNDDKALELLAAHHIDFDPNSAEAKRVLRKIDMRIMPMCFFVYILMLMASAKAPF
jgi:hypothetical protein